MYRRILIASYVLCSTLLVTTPATAQESAVAPDPVPAAGNQIERFEDLPAEAQIQFAEFRERWAVMREPVTKAWQHWQTMSEADRTITMRAMQRWAKMTPRQRRDAQREAERLEKLPEARKQALLAGIANEARPDVELYELEILQNNRVKADRPLKRPALSTNGPFGRPPAQ